MTWGRLFEYYLIILTQLIMGGEAAVAVIFMLLDLAARNMLVHRVQRVRGKKKKC